MKKKIYSGFSPEKIKTRLNIFLALYLLSLTKDYTKNMVFLTLHSNVIMIMNLFIESLKIRN